MSSRLSSQHQEGDFLLDAVTELMATLDLYLRIRWANLAAGKSVNEDPENLVGRYCYQVWHGRKSPCEKCPVQGTIKTGEPEEDEVESPDGRYWHVRSYPLRSPEGILEGVAELTLEITDRKRAEEKRNHAVEHQQILLDNIQTQVWYLIDERTYGAVNKSHAKFQGLTAEDMSFQDLFDLYPKDVAEICRQGNLEVFSKGQPVPTEEWVPHASGEWRLLSIQKTPKLRVDGTVEYVVCSGEDITERKQVEEALQESEERYRKLINTSPDAIALVDEQGRFLTVNPTMAQRFDLTQEELEGKTYHDVMPKDLADKRITDAKKSLNNEELVCIEDERQDRYLQNYYVPLTTSDDLRSFQIISRDITEQKKAEKKFRTLFESANDAIFLMQEDQFVECNTKTLEMFNCTREQIIGEPPYLFSPEIQPDGRYSREKSIEKINSCLQGVPQFFEWRHSRYDGTSFDTEISLNQVKLGQDVFVQAIVRDITQRKQMEKELRDSKEFSSTLMDKAPYPIVVISSDSSVRYINSALENLTGFTYTEVVGKKPPFPWWTKESLQQIEKDFKKMFYEDLQRMEYWFQKKNGEIFCVEMNATKLLKENGEITYYLSNWVDITERKQMEEKLKEMSIRDSLTGLYNRNFFEGEMNRLSDGRHNPLGIIVCDLDGLKFINDTLGHLSGDQMLITIADILRGNFRASDIIARIGGDEFAILLTETDPDTVEQMLHRLRKAMRDYKSADPEVPLSLSLGFAVSERATTDMQALFREADNRMYREKIQREGSARSAILQALTGTMQARDFHTEGHCDRLQELAASLARSLDLSQDLINVLFLLARFHDLGKVGVSDHILFKQGALTKEEWRQIRQHCEIGHRIASYVPDLELIADYILKHHERWDGQGYPLGISGEDIPLACRILAIVDAYDAMTSDRPYRRAMTHDEAIAELKRCAGTQFDPELVERFIGLW